MLVQKACPEQPVLRSSRFCCGGWKPALSGVDGHILGMAELFSDK